MKSTRLSKTLVGCNLLFTELISQEHLHSLSKSVMMAKDIVIFQRKSDEKEVFLYYQLFHFSYQSIKL